MICVFTNNHLCEICLILRVRVFLHVFCPYNQQQERGVKIKSMCTMRFEDPENVPHIWYIYIWIKVLPNNHKSELGPKKLHYYWKHNQMQLRIPQQENDFNYQNKTKNMCEQACNTHVVMDQNMFSQRLWHLLHTMIVSGTCFCLRLTVLQ